MHPLTSQRPYQMEPLWCLELEVVRLASSGGNAGEGATSSDCGAGLECASNPLDASRLACLVLCSETTNCGDANACVGFTDTTAYCLPVSAGRTKSAFKQLYRLCRSRHHMCSHNSCRSGRLSLQS